MNTKEIIKRINLAEDVRDKVFSSLQMTTYYTLYYDQDFSKQQVKNFNKFLKKYNEEFKLYETEKLKELDQKHKNNLGVDCWKMAVNFPHRPKMKLYGKKTKHVDIVLQNTNECIEDYLLLCVFILHKHYRFSAARIKQWWEQVIEFSRLYVDGLTDEHVVKYFIQECNLKITD